MNILIIGNGFDLEHGLPTKYYDFLNFIKTFKKIDKIKNGEYIEEFESLNESIKKYILTDEVTFYNVDNVLNEFNNLIQQNIWIDYFIREINYKEKGWIDFELEISEVVKSIDYYAKLSYGNYYGNKKVENDNRKEDIAINFFKGHPIENHKDGWIDYLCVEKFDIIKDLIITDLNNMIRCLEIYLEKCVSNIEIKYKSPTIEEIHIDALLSFNYSSTYEKLYGKGKSIKYDYIHGKSHLSKELPNNMVLGIDEYLDNNLKDKELDFVQFKKYFQRIYKRTGCEYKKWIEEINNSEIEYEFDSEEIYIKDTIHNVYIFGHSLDVTDKDVLREIILAKDVVTTIFYHDDISYIQYISNLVKIIGQDELIKRVHGTSPSIIFQKQKERIER